MYFYLCISNGLRDEDLVQNYLTPDLKVLDLVNSLMTKGNLTDDSKGQLSSLRNRIDPNKKIAPVVVVKPDLNSTNQKAPSKHIMISYAWKAGKPLIEALQAQLISMGHDVWRDETGSQVVSPMQGDVLEKMAETIEHSHTIIMCISRW